MYIFVTQVEYFTELNLRVTSEICPNILKNYRPYKIASTQWSGEFSITLKLCRYLTMSKLAMVKAMTEYGVGKWSPLLD